MARHNRRFRQFAAPVGLAVALTITGCGSSDSSESSKTTTTTAAPSATSTTVASSETAPLKILVSNDDGYSADGIDTLVEALGTLDNVEISVVAPLDQRSGTGGSQSDGPLAQSDVKLKSGHGATAVDGFPADTIRVAIDEIGLEPDVVIAGINQGQNLGPLIDVSGTVGAARAAVTRGIPALSASQGTGEAFDYEAAVPLIIDWVTKNRDALVSGEAEVHVTNLNIPSCDTGEMRGLVEVEAALDGDVGASLSHQDCTSTQESDSLDEVEAFNAGFATINVIPAEPAQ